MSNLKVANVFGVYPAGRYRTDGSFSGEAFREDHLIPALENADMVVVDFDGAMGYGSSFLDEAFGGLIRSRRFDVPYLHSKLQFVSSEEPTLIEEVWSYIDAGNP